MRSRGELVISMTLAETFLLLVFMLWYSVRPKVQAKPSTPIAAITAENEKLKKENAELQNELSDIQRRLEWWRARFDQPVPGSEEELKKVLFEAGRGRPKCQDNNVLVDISLVNGSTTVKVLADSPGLREALVARRIDFHAGAVITNGSEIETMLREAAAFRKSAGSDGDCRFDYRFNYATFEDYYAGRERFEKYFYSAGRQRIAQPDQR
jgi:hypothetical protein